MLQMLTFRTGSGICVKQISIAVDALAVTWVLAYQQRRNDILHARQYTLNSSL